MTFSNLHDAFEELERRADAAGDLVGAPGPGRPRRRHASRPMRRGATALAVAATAVAVAAVAIGVGFASGGGSQHVAGASNPPNHSITAAVRSSTAPSITPTQPAVAATDVPESEADLIARFRSILNGTATFTVDSADSTDRLITGVLTSASGSRGLYVLELDKDVAICGEMGRAGEAPTPLPCPGVTTLADGSKLKVDPNFPDGPPDGVMNDAILNRPDGWQISLYTANVEAKHYGAPVLGTEPALTVNQVTDVVTSPEWLAK